MMKRMTLALLGTLLLSLPPVAACTPHAPKDSLSADGPYILYGPGGVDVTGVDVQGDISREHWDRLPDGFTSQVTDHRGKYPFEVRLRPFTRAD